MHSVENVLRVHFQQVRALLPRLAGEPVRDEEPVSSDANSEVLMGATFLSSCGHVKMSAFMVSLEALTLASFSLSSALSAFSATLIVSEQHSAMNSTSASSKGASAACTA